MTTRIYRVDGPDGPSGPKLVRASNRAQAISHVARAEFIANVATQDDLVYLLAKGVVVESAAPIAGEAA